MSSENNPFYEEALDAQRLAADSFARNTARTKIMNGLDNQEKQRIRLGWQCPECFGPIIEPRTRTLFSCLTCGAQWDGTAPQFSSHPEPEITT